MNAACFCAEYGHELKNGRVSFSKQVVNKFIERYTYFKPEDFTDDMRERLKVSLMIDLHQTGYSKYSIFDDEDDFEKIELSDFILKG